MLDKEWYQLYFNDTIGARQNNDYISPIIICCKLKCETM